MQLQIQIDNAWAWFSIAFGVMLLATFIMNKQSRNFYTIDVVERKFGIMDLEFASNAQEIVNIMKGMFKLPAEKSQKAVKALRAQIITDFILFMPATYGGIFILCMKVSEKMGPVGQIVFPLLAWLQGVAFLLDAIENIFLLNKISPDPKLSKPSAHKSFLMLEAFKWGIALIAAIGSFSALLYYWVSGMYGRPSLPYAGIVIGEIIVFIILGKVTSKKTIVEV